MDTLLKVDDCRVSYLNKSFNLTVNRGELILIKGPNGAGKTTLFKLILGLEKIVNGEILRNYKCISYVPEHIDLPSHLTGIEVVEMVKKAIRSESELRELSLLDIPLFKEVKRLSFGNCKKLQVLVHTFIGRDIVLIDEPFIGLDVKAIQSLRKYLMYLNKKGVAILLIAHKIRLLDKLANQVIHLD